MVSKGVMVGVLCVGSVCVGAFGESILYNIEH